MYSYINVCKKTDNLHGSIYITGSKSISNRLLILKAIYGNDIYIDNISDCDDTNILKKSLISTSNILDINHAGTAMRFLTSYLSIQEKKEVILTGSNRMKERPISVLVDSLIKLGAKIDYLEKIGFPPIKIFGKKILGGKITIDAKISSQYISSLMLIASKFENGLKIFLENHITSLPYIKMTFDLLISSGIIATWTNKMIHIYPGKKIGKKYFKVESDWSSASYYYSMVSISKNSNVTLYSYNKKSLQGDKMISTIYKKYFGISTIFNNNEIKLVKNINFYHKKYIELNLNETPDIAQTIAVTCASLGIKCKLKGLETLRIKETDRLEALKKELLKFGIITNITNYDFEIKDFYKNYKEKKLPIEVKTYQDHRMAMSFTTFALCCFSLKIEEPYVVNKSYPNFWKDLKHLSFSITM
ncbi:3-phosphoshikimate 1-carboxyvinyltransferase [Blattabacterium cuenoti]|uniref:3-phosphoshikimate 1-carboxyvinyltransferase n=1 Tax=Blattabacterium cuenoti TaxID=1653831 RepID=UPI00163C3405|nr:3-phosphoshikimate 1-carboxyvinyltransferase [Blattabacterium cuenoti]